MALRQLRSGGGSKRCWRCPQNGRHRGSSTASRCPAGEHIDQQPLPVQRHPLAVLSYGQWQGADHQNRERYQAGNAAATAAMRTLLPPGRVLHLQVPVSCEPEPEREFGQARALPRILRQQQDASALLAAYAPDRAITLGGDCGIEPAPIGYFNCRHAGNMALLWLDSHGDLNSSIQSPSGNYHGMALRDLIEPGSCGGDTSYPDVVPRALLPSQIVMAGVRSLDPPEHALLQAARVPVIAPSSLIARSGASRTHGSNSDAVEVGDLIEALNVHTGMSDPSRQLYIHLDLDVLDPRWVLRQNHFRHYSAVCCCATCCNLRHHFATIN